MHKFYISLKEAVYAGTPEYRNEVEVTGTKALDSIIVSESDPDKLYEIVKIFGDNYKKKHPEISFKPTLSVLTNHYAYYHYQQIDKLLLRWINGVPPLN